MVPDTFENISPWQQQAVLIILENPSIEWTKLAPLVGVSESTVRRHQDTLLEIVTHVKANVLTIAANRLKDLVLQAVIVKESGLASDDEKIRQQTATEIIDWNLDGMLQALHAESQADSFEDDLDRVYGE